MDVIASDQPATPDGPPRSYVLERSSEETARLQLQARLYDSASEHLLRAAGIDAGMRVLDVGTGAGDVALLLARLVGPSGAVLAVDSDPDILDVARRRAAQATLDNIDFRCVDVREMAPTGPPLDAVVGRLVLTHLPDAVDVVRSLATLLRPGGIVTFQDFAASRSRSTPPCPYVDQVSRWAIDAVTALGADPDTGDRLPALLRGAGLAHVGLSSVQPAATHPADPGLDYLAAMLRMTAPVLQRTGLATAEDLDLERVRARLGAEVEAVGATVHLPALVGAWSTTAR